jgi:hypothetical protein
MDKSVHIELNKIEKVAKPRIEDGLFVVRGVCCLTFILRS